MRITKKFSYLTGLISTILLMVILVISLLNSTAKPAFSQKISWVPANGKFCERVCRDAGKNAVYSGTYTNGNEFYICATNAGGEGLRPGYNLLPNWATTCTVGLGGQEKSYSQYYCQCQ
jgi:hypothetical protein